MIPNTILLDTGYSKSSMHSKSHSSESKYATHRATFGNDNYIMGQKKKHNIYICVCVKKFRILQDLDVYELFSGEGELGRQCRASFNH